MKTITKILFIIILVSILSLLQANCKSAANYDIRGTWSVILSYFDGTSDLFLFTFTGDLEAGIVNHTGVQYPGTYTVSGSSVEFSIDYVVIYTRSTETYKGSFDNATTMSGTFEWDTSIIVAKTPPMVWAWGDWTATKQ